MDISLLRQFDLNSLLTLKVLLETQHVTQAAERLNLTQSAVSRTLSKLRDNLNDPILVRSGKGLVCTKTAESLLPKVNLILEQVHDILKPEAFDPSQCEGTLRLATTDYGTHNLLPKLAPILCEVAPSLKLFTLNWRSNLLTELEDNSVDLMIGGVVDPPDSIYQRIVSNDTYHAICRKGHPFADKLTMENYLSLNHLIISSSGKGRSRVDAYLNDRGLHRNVCLTVPHFFAALEIISSTDYMILLPSRFIRRYVDPAKFEIVKPPFSAPTIDVAMFWHARTQHDPLNKWFRQFVYDSIYARKKKPKMSSSVN